MLKEGNTIWGGGQISCKNIQLVLVTVKIVDFFFFFKNTIVFLFFNTHPRKLFQDFVEIHCVLTSQSWSGVCNAYLLRSQLYNCPRNGIVGLFLTRNHAFFSFTNLKWLDGKRLLESGLMLGLNHYI